MLFSTNVVFAATVARLVQVLDEGGDRLQRGDLGVDDEQDVLGVLERLQRPLVEPRSRVDDDLVVGVEQGRQDLVDVLRR